MTNPAPPSPAPAAKPYKFSGIEITGMLFFGTLLILFVFLKITEKPKIEPEIVTMAAPSEMGTLEGRARAMAKSAFFMADGPPTVTLMPQVDGGDRIKIEYKISDNNFTSNPAKGRERVLQDIQTFMAKFQDSGGNSGVAYFWFSPRAVFVDQYGATFQKPIAKIMIDRAVANKVVNWRYLSPDQVESLFSSEGTLEWDSGAMD